MAQDGAGLKLILFDLDGTLVDGAPAIVAAMDAAFTAIDREPPPAEAVRLVIGLSLSEAIARLDPSLTPAALQAATDAYRGAYRADRAAGGAESGSPLYPGARAALERLATTDALLGVATGKARRGLEHALEVHALRPYFATTQTASEGPGKPHPAMIERALSETGTTAAQTVMVGDAIYDMEMARNAGAAAIGVAWGYHARAALLEAGAAAVVERFDQLEPALDRLWGAEWRRA